MGLKSQARAGLVHEPHMASKGKGKEGPMYVN